MVFKKGYKSPRKGISMEQEYGEEKAKELKKRISENSGHLQTDITKNKIKETTKTWWKENRDSDKVKKRNEKISINKYKHGMYTIRKVVFDIFKNPYICQICHSTKKIIVHHIDKNRYNNKIENIIILCSTCHYNIHKKLRRKEILKNVC